ncbi:MAG: anaerobic glycerol-3-phosphate dehydrogenase subunit GlpB, partial [Candidatus Cryptobacteroides sp.]
KNLPDGHPYSLMGHGKVMEIAGTVKDFFAAAGIVLSGEEGRNHFRITPLGVLKPAWLTLEDYARLDSDKSLPWKKVTIANIEGFLDFHPDFIAAGLSGLGAECHCRRISLPELDRLRNNPSEMRSANIARALTGSVIGNLAKRLSDVSAGSDVILMPAVLGLEDPRAAQSLKVRTDLPIEYIATLPPSVPGIRTQMMLKNWYTKLGGTYLLGDSVTGGDFEANHLKGIRTVNHSDKLFCADSFILASGSFFSRGLLSTPSGIFEPVFNLQVKSPGERKDWASQNFFDRQPYMRCGVETDGQFRAVRNGEIIDNLRVCGSLLSEADPINEGCGAGLAIISALYVAEKITDIQA